MMLFHITLIDARVFD